MAILPENTAVIGRLPGYNEKIDSGFLFEDELLKGVTFIDLKPTSYKLAADLVEANNNFTLFTKSAKDFYKKPALFESNSDISLKIFKGVLKRMQKLTGLPEVDMIRIIAANDSTFNEVFSNNFGEKGILTSIADAVADKLSSIKYVNYLSRGVKTYSHSQMIEFASGLYDSASQAGSNKLADLLTGAAFGMQLAAPTLWNSSSYSSNLTLFIKLISPTGSPECIKKNILEPLLYLLAAASPLTYGGLMYGYPLLWEVHAHGITTFKVGQIAAMTLIRGSFETTFNYALQPTILDVRLTIVPIIEQFAVQGAIKDGDAVTDLYSEDNVKNLGTQTPADISRGLTNGDVSIKTIKL